MQLLGLSGAKAHVHGSAAGGKDFLQKQYKMEKIFYIDEVKVWFNQVQQNQISFSKFVELLNEKATNPKEPETVHGNEAEKEGCKHEWVYHPTTGYHYCIRCHDMRYEI